MDWDVLVSTVLSQKPGVILRDVVNYCTVYTTTTVQLSTVVVRIPEEYLLIIRGVGK